MILHLARRIWTTDLRITAVVTATVLRSTSWAIASSHNTHPVQMHVVFALMLIIWQQLMAAGTCTQQWSHWMNRIKYRTKNVVIYVWCLSKIMVLWDRTWLHQCLGHTIIFALFCGHAGCWVTHHLAFVHSDGSESILHQPIKSNLEKLSGPPASAKIDLRASVVANEYQCFTPPQFQTKFDSKYQFSHGDPYHIVVRKILIICSGLSVLRCVLLPLVAYSKVEYQLQLT